MMRKILIMAVAASMFIWAGSAWAVSITYTADNVTDTWYVQGETGDAENLAAGANRSNWQVADTAVLDLAPDSNFTFVWSVTNSGAYSTGNPAAFLAQIDLGNSADLILSDIDWSYSENGFKSDDFNHSDWNWQAVTAYGYNGGANIWTNVKGSAVEGISTDAQWIWSENNFANGDLRNLFIRVDIKTAAVPEPGTLLLLGSGLAALALYRRRSMNK